MEPDLTLRQPAVSAEEVNEKQMDSNVWPGGKLFGVLVLSFMF